VQQRALFRTSSRPGLKEHGAWRPKADVDSLAYAVVRIAEGFIYNDALLAIEPEVERAASIVALLREP
jgi:hypothetical protein